jgi:mRNA-degrading endonuclease YafQ of YafQ-DinJ toxin-antitoxin module
MSELKEKYAPKYSIEYTNKFYKDLKKFVKRALNNNTLLLISLFDKIEK